MATVDLTKQLHEAADDIASEDGYDVFEAYWELAKPLLNGLKVSCFYVREEEDYTNVGILAGEVVIDIEAIEDDDRGHISVYRIDAISSVSFYEDPVPTVPDSDNAELVVTANSMQGNELLVYWMAHDEDDASALLTFGSTLVKLLSVTRG